VCGNVCLQHWLKGFEGNKIGMAIALCCGAARKANKVQEAQTAAPITGDGRATVKAVSHTACRAYAVPLPCHAAKGLECVFPI